LSIGTDVRFRAVVVEGSVPDALLGYSAGNVVDLIVMTTHGRTGIGRAVLGSVSDMIVRRAQSPVLLIRPSRHGPEEHEPAAVSEIVVLLDGSPAGERVLEHAIAVGRLTGAACTLLHVVVPELLLTGVAAPGAMSDQRSALADEQMSEAYLATQAERFRTRDVPLTTATIRHPDLAEGVLGYCATHPVSLIAMATRGRGGVQRAVLGSTTDTLLHRMRLPILVLSSEAHAIPL
jgi:nucleotide-binding universal stress UspA family protein